jgi:hypothetical protein
MGNRTVHESFRSRCRWLTASCKTRAEQKTALAVAASRALGNDRRSNCGLRAGLAVRRGRWEASKSERVTPMRRRSPRCGRRALFGHEDGVTSGNAEAGVVSDEVNPEFAPMVQRCLGSTPYQTYRPLPDAPLPPVVSGIVFVVALWSGPALASLRMLRDVLDECGKCPPQLFVIDTDEKLFEAWGRQRSRSFTRSGRGRGSRRRRATRSQCS